MRLHSIWATPMLLAAACAAGSTDSNATNKEPTMQDAQAVSTQMGIVFPAGATVEHAEQIEGRDNAARATLLLSTADWEALKASLVPAGADQPPFSADANFHLGPDEGGWSPGKAPGLSTVQIPWRNGTEALNLGFAPANGRVRVFLFWHQL